MAGNGSQEASRYAHFEVRHDSSLGEIYHRHGEVARDIFQTTLRNFTNNYSLNVALIGHSPVIVNQDTLDIMTNYDVISGSAELSIKGVVESLGAGNANNAKLYRRYFEQEDMPIISISAGNKGTYAAQDEPRLADFSRTSLIVGEANFNQDRPYVEEHSSDANPTLTSDTPFNRGEKYQYFNLNPSLEGHDDLIISWMVDREVERRVNAQLPVSDVNELIAEAYTDLEREGYDQSAEFLARLENYKANPNELHQQVLPRLMKDAQSDGIYVDYQGYVSHLDGTSFASPEMAGYLAGAHYEQEGREEKNLPILTKEEISGLAKMATIDIEHREGHTGFLETYNNRAGFEFTNDSGHGVFRPDLFRDLLNHAYRVLEVNPELDRDAVTLKMTATPDEVKGADFTQLTLEAPDNQTVVIERARLDFDFVVDNIVNGFPETVALKTSDDSGYKLHDFSVSIDDNRSNFFGWSRQEMQFGETIDPDSTWEIYIPNGDSTRLINIQATIYGYNEGGFMDQMIGYTQSVMPAYMPEAEIVKAVEVQNMPLNATLPAVKN